MAKYSFAVGERVRYVPRGWPGTPTSAFRVLSRHGEEGPDPGYRLLDLEGGSMRLGVQSELETAENRVAAE
jgi:hypothetical protein